MAILRMKDIEKLGSNEIKEKLKDLKIELMKAALPANRTNAKTKEIKRAISRLITFSKSSAKAEKKAEKSK